MHHKEVLLAVDTAKIILAAYPDARLVIAGLSAQIMTSTPSTRRQLDAPDSLADLRTGGA